VQKYVVQLTSQNTTCNFSVLCDKVGPINWKRTVTFCMKCYLFFTTQFAECHMHLRKVCQRHDATDVDVETSNDAH